MGLKKLKTNSDYDFVEVITYDKSKRMLYHPDFHIKQGIRFTSEELEYLSMFYGFDQCRTLAFGLGKTESVITAKYHYLKRKGLLDFYRNRYIKKYEAYNAGEELSKL
ncbi:hypothetical protein [Paenibacillus sinopodophylli]|uniref:hypothetical protein n=1 Tax=Paenibacillus sinopodophylli TaxID=1837342 RepID=UPI00110D0953|nr:hypothetical protein [Paenibacillus sinopodophylli]